VIKNDIKHATSANVEVRIIEESMLHVLFVKFTVNLGPGSLYRVVNQMKKDRNSLRNSYPDGSTLGAIQDPKLNSSLV
jgi:hypothetical protein